MTQTDNDALVRGLEAWLHTVDDQDIAYFGTVVLAALRSPAPVVDGARYRHNVRGTEYDLIGTALLQSAKPIAEGNDLAVYRGDDGQLWARPASEFYDGRFEQIEAALRSSAPVVDDDPYRILKNALFALEKQKSETIEYGGVLTDGGKKVWIKYEVRSEATRPQPAQDEVELVARIIDPKIWAIHDDIAGRPDEADWFESWRAGSIKDGGAWGTSLAKATAAITALRQHSGESGLREALEPFASFADTFVDAEGWTNSMRRERIVDWFGPSDFRKARAALGGGGEA